MDALVLGIESSCDDTAAAVILGNRVLSNEVANQEIHKKYGGVVPEWASRVHQQNIVPVVHVALKKANVQKKDLQAVAYTQGPGLPGSLLVGIHFAKSLAKALGIPAIPVDHLQAHILAHFIEDANPSPPEFPFLCLTVSGGHTQLVWVTDYFDHEIIGKTLDDAAGEAFDKIGKLLGLDYPAGKFIDELAAQGEPHWFKFPTPKMDGFNFSFSGLKTSVLYFLREQLQHDPDFIAKNLYDLCASVQFTIVNYLMEVLEKAAHSLNAKHIAISGGVSANSYLRQRIRELAEKDFKTYIPKFEYTTDNAAMVAMVGVIRLKNLSDK